VERNSKWNKGSNSIGEAVYLPNVSIGTCRNARNCGQFFNVDLANGQCVSCWDSGITTKEEQTEKRKYIKKSRHTHIRAGKNTWII